MKRIKSSLFNMVFVLTLIAAISAIAVSMVYIKTKPTIDENLKITETRAITALFGNDFDNDPLEEKTVIHKKNGKDMIIYPLRKNDSVYALAINTHSGKGFGGNIYLMVGFYLDGTMAGYEVLSHQETPGLGSKITENKFMDQFKNLYLSENSLALRSHGGEIDAITSATISSKAVLDAVKRAKKAYDKFTLGAKNE